ncbi:MAG TPA: cupin domain-containing protein [Gemmatimonadaceae bacterium]|jgi:quercetin dioxygenase-like cupin family protein
MRAVILTVAALAFTGALAPQQPAFKRTVLQQGDLSVAGHEVISAVADFEPRATPGRHTHPGEEIGYVLEGTFLIEQEGKAPVTLKTGGSFLIPAGKIHNATNTGTGPGKILATYIVEKGKPLATPAPTK